MNKPLLNCLHEFRNYAQFIGYVEDELHIVDWVIWDAKLSDRANYLDYNRKGAEEGAIYYQKLQQDALINSITAEPGEIVTWIDTLRILYEALIQTVLPAEVLDNLTIIQEYCIPFTHKRADYILSYKNKMLILEFSFDNHDWLQYDTKLQQVVGYKERLSVLCPSNIEIGSYVYIIKPESISPNIQTKLPVNDKSTFALAQYIRIFFTKGVVNNATQQLYFLNADEKDVTKSIR